MAKLYAFYFVIISHITLYFRVQSQHISHNQIQDKANIINISYNRCSAEKMCIHGICNEKLGKCVCYYGWRGDECDKLVRNNHLFKPRRVTRNEAFKTRYNAVTTTKHRRLTNPDRYVIDLLMAFFPKLKGYFKRILDLGVVNKQTTNTFFISPVANSKFAMDVKAKTAARRQMTTEPPEIETTSAFSDVMPTSEEVQEEPENGVCSDNYKQRPLSERMCTPGLVCTYGSCSSDHKGSYIAFDCSCDKGASGLLCENKCCLDCGKHGRCAIFADGKPYCSCRKGYFGDNCEHFESEVKIANPHFPLTSKLYNTVFSK